MASRPSDDAFRDDAFRGMVVLFTEIARGVVGHYDTAQRIGEQVCEEFFATPINEVNSHAIIVRIRAMAPRGAFPTESYETGYRDGESNRQADWDFALDEYCDLPEDVDTQSPVEVAQYIDRLQKQIPRLPEGVRYE